MAYLSDAGGPAWPDEVIRKAKEQARALPGALSTSSALRVASVVL
jgi:hypothetical protein